MRRGQSPRIQHMHESQKYQWLVQMISIIENVMHKKIKLYLQFDTIIERKNLAFLFVHYVCVVQWYTDSLIHWYTFKIQISRFFCVRIRIRICWRCYWSLVCYLPLLIYVHFSLLFVYTVALRWLRCLTSRGTLAVACKHIETKKNCQKEGKKQINLIIIIITSVCESVRGKYWILGKFFFPQQSRCVCISFFSFHLDKLSSMITFL